jgi:hypothetical protein
LIKNNIEEALWRLVDQKWRDLLNIAAAEPQSIDHGQEARKIITESTKKLSQDKPIKPHRLRMAIASVEATGRPPRKCKFAGGIGLHQNASPMDVQSLYRHSCRGGGVDYRGQQDVSLLLAS